MEGVKGKEDSVENAECGVEKWMKAALHVPLAAVGFVDPAASQPGRDETRPRTELTEISHRACLTLPCLPAEQRPCPFHLSYE